MNYEVILRPEAEADLAKLPADLQAFVEHRLGLLGQSPVLLGRRVASPPFAPGSQMYEFDRDFGGQTFHHFVVFFHYGQDEATLFVTGIGHIEYRRGI